METGCGPAMTYNSLQRTEKEYCKELQAIASTTSNQTIEKKIYQSTWLQGCKSKSVSIWSKVTINNKKNGNWLEGLWTIGIEKKNAI